jgi:hypothetical protein
MACGYVAYIDEAGDDGLYSPMRPDEPHGASEWMAMAAVVVRTENDKHAVAWAKQIIRDINQHQVRHLHFRTLREEKKPIVCSAIAKLPVRCFVVLSHKLNMKGHRNLAAERAKVNRTAWFYCWLSRLLLERVTGFCASRTMMDYGENREIRIEFSDRGGLNIEDVKLYYAYLRDQSRLGMLHLDLYDLAWNVVDVVQMLIYPNRMRAGLQLADTVASAFFQAVERTAEGIVRPECAKLLEKTICRGPNGKRYGFGLKVMPTWIPSRLPADQGEILKFFLAK